MTRDEATRAAQTEANDSGLVLVVAHNPHAEFGSEEWTYYPEGAQDIFKHETVVETIHPGGTSFQFDTRSN